MTTESWTQPTSPDEPPYETAPYIASPIYSLEAEEAVIGAVLIDPDLFPTLAEILHPSDFRDQRHRSIYSACWMLSGKGTPLDIVTISNELQETGKLDDAGGPAYITGLLNRTPTSLHAESYANIVKDKSVRRAFLANANELANLTYSQKINNDEIAARFMEMAQGSTGRAMREIILRTDADALKPHDPRQWVVENLIIEKSLTVLYADAGSKKTYISLALAESVCHGIPWLAYTTQAAPVLYLDEENGEDEIDERLDHILRGLNRPPSEKFYTVSYAGLLLDNRGDILKIKTLIDRTGAKLVILDSLQDFMTGDENSKQDTQPIFTALKKLANQTGAAILVQHHAGKNGDYRGSSTIKGNVDMMLEVKSTEDSNLITFKSKKKRRGSAVQFSAEASWWNDSFTLTTSNRQTVRTMSKAKDYVIRFFTEHPGATIEDCENNADVCKRGTARNTLFSLAGRGILQRTNTGKIANYALASVTSNERVTDE